MLKSHGLSNEKIHDKRPAGDWTSESQKKSTEPNISNAERISKHKSQIQSQIMKGIDHGNNSIVFEAFAAARYIHKLCFSLLKAEHLLS